MSMLHLNKAGKHMEEDMEINHVTVMASTINPCSRRLGVSETLVHDPVHLRLGIDGAMLPHLAVAIAPCMVNTVEMHVTTIVVASDARIGAEAMRTASGVPIANVGVQVPIALAMNCPHQARSLSSMIPASAKE